MAYLPFYITPEKFQEYQADRKEKIVSNSNAVSWNCNNVEEKYRLFRTTFWIIPCLGMILIAILFASAFKEPIWSWTNPVMYALVIPIFIVGVAAHYSYGLDDRYSYTLSDAGLIYSKRYDEPLWMPKLVQVTAYIGSSASILAVAIMGPLALVGSGGFLLLAFACTKKREIDVEEWVVPSDQFVCARHFKHLKVICLYAKKEKCEDIGHVDYPNYINRTQNRGDFLLFYRTPKQLEDIRKVLEQSLSINIEDTINPELIFNFRKRPQVVIDIPMVSDMFHREDTLTKFDDPPPPGKTQKEVDKKVKEIFGKV